LFFGYDLLDGSVLLIIKFLQPGEIVVMLFLEGFEALFEVMVVGDQQLLLQLTPKLPRRSDPLGIIG
jgi:hypothetical protein